jgi:hypothetical protein
VTIAVCYLSPEGVVLGADSTTTYGGGTATAHYYNNAQKLFQIGQDSTLGLVAWGLGGLITKSHRTLVALLADDLQAQPPKTVEDVADRWVEQFWQAYSDPNSPLSATFSECKRLAAKTPYVSGQASPTARTEAEEKQLAGLSQALVAGFCIGGYLPTDRRAVAFEIVFDPLKGRPKPAELVFGSRFWGAPNMIQRLILGCDNGVKDAIIGSGKWAGTRAELDALVGNHALSHPVVPIRDAIDFVHTCIVSTIKAFKFSNYSQICGGPIEIAVITTDRNFRWVKHKAWDAAINEGEQA